MRGGRTGSFLVGLVFGLMAFVTTNLSLASVLCEAQELYRDKQGYYKFSPPPGWLHQEASEDQMSKVKFAPPEGGASLRLNVRPADASETKWEELLAEKKLAQQKIQKELPKAKVSLTETSLGGTRCIQIITEIPGSHFQENYVYVKSGLHFNLSYAAPRQADFDKHRQAVLEALRSIQTGK